MLVQTEKKKQYSELYKAGCQMQALSIYNQLVPPGNLLERMLINLMLILYILAHCSLQQAVQE